MQGNVEVARCPKKHPDWTQGSGPGLDASTVCGTKEGGSKKQKLLGILHLKLISEGNMGRAWRSRKEGSGKTFREGALEKEVKE